MVSTLKMLATLTVICIAAFGLLLAFDVITMETIKSNSIQVMGGIGVLVFTVIALKAISGRGPGGGQMDPPPTL